MKSHLLTRRAFPLLAVLLTSTLLSGCANSPSRQSAVQQGTAVGAVSGGVLGGVIGNNVGDGENQVLGAALGAIAGGVAGNRIATRRADTQSQIQAAQNAANTHVVNVSNSNGSITPVTLVHIGNGQWRGPRGEIYNNLPGEPQLKPVYGI